MIQLTVNKEEHKLILEMIEVFTLICADDQKIEFAKEILNRESVIEPEIKYVPHLMRYHAEIQYEGEIAMRYVCAAGETLDELAQDITKELRKVKHRLPQIVHVEDIDMGELITEVFIQDYNKGVYNG